MCDGRAGAGLVIDDGTERSFRLADNTSICSAELTAINESIKIAEERGIERLAIFSDSVRTLRSLQEGTSADHPALFNDIFVVLESVRNRGFRFEMCWIPSHVGIIGNEHADSLTKVATTRQNIDRVMVSEMKELKDKVDVFTLSKWQSMWQKEKTGREYFELESKVSNQAKYQNKNRHHDVTITRLRLRKCLVNYYLFKIKRHRNGLCDTCGVKETVEHFIMQCRNNNKLIRKLKSACIEQKSIVVPNCWNYPVFAFFSEIKGATSMVQLSPCRY